MNVLLINHYAGSPKMGMEFRPYYFAKEWIRSGYHVTVIAGDFSHLRKQNPVVEHDFQEEEVDGVPYLWVKTGSYDSNGSARAFSMFRFCHKLSKNARRIAEELKPDVVISSSTYPLDSYPAKKIADIAGAEYIHEVHDMWPSTLYEAGGMSKHHPFVVLMQMAENHAYKTADHVVSLLPNAEDYMREHGLKPGKFHYIPNCVLVDEWDESLPLPEEHAETFRKLREEGKFILGYTGSHEFSYGLYNLLDVVKEMEDENVFLVMVGGGKLKPDLIAYAKDKGIRNVAFLPQVEKTMIPAVLHNVDAIYIGTIESPLYRFGICMNKMFDAMMSGKPIVMAITTPSTPVSEAGCGIITTSCNNEGIKEGIRELMAMSPEERAAMGARGHEAVLRRFSYDVVPEEFAKLFRA